jgi:hypothetical protein
MACPTGRCALRRFDGHGTNSYRPSNSALAAEGEARLAAMLAERRAVDSIWGGPATEDHPAQPASRPMTALLSTTAVSSAPVICHASSVAPATGITPWRTPSASAASAPDKMRLTHK